MNPTIYFLVMILRRPFSLITDELDSTHHHELVAALFLSAESVLPSFIATGGVVFVLDHQAAPPAFHQSYGVGYLLFLLLVLGISLFLLHMYHSLHAAYKYLTGSLGRCL